MSPLLPARRVRADPDHPPAPGEWPATVAGVYGLNPQGGSTSALHRTRAGESPLAEHLQLVREGGASREGFFLRAETMHSLFTHQEEITVDAGIQVVISTHSPVLAAFPGARLLELGDWGMRESSYEELDLVRSRRAFLDAPQRFLRHLP
ncbi:hypothetical protein [Brachybacterium squillarum]|uniref:hypothetical protein n=1 Tax=Brachybacterium squillarum TaxID=661979 RepID=UPI000262972D|nr:hypothetical protein [Brachybacterium squillarum]